MALPNEWSAARQGKRLARTEKRNGDGRSAESRRRKAGRLRAGLRGDGDRGQPALRSARMSDDGHRFVEKFDLRGQHRAILPLLLCASFADLLAKPARVRAVESSLHRIDQRSLTRARHDHRGPRDRLQDEPMRPAAEEQGEDEEEASEVAGGGKQRRRSWKFPPRCQCVAAMRIVSR